MWSRQFSQVFSKPTYVLIAILIAWFVFTFAILLPNFRLVGVVLFSGTASLMDKVTFLFSLYGSISTNFTLVSAITTVAISVLFGINIALFVSYIRRARKLAGNIGSTGFTGMSGLLSGVFGIGCATCGTFILTPLLILIGVGGILLYLPLKGAELGLIGIVLLIYSIYSLVKKLGDPLVCSVET